MSDKGKIEETEQEESLFEGYKANTLFCARMDEWRKGMQNKSGMIRDGFLNGFNAAKFMHYTDSVRDDYVETVYQIYLEGMVKRHPPDEDKGTAIFMGEYAQSFIDKSMDEFREKVKVMREGWTEQMIVHCKMCKEEEGPFLYIKEMGGHCCLPCAGHAAYSMWEKS